MFGWAKPAEPSPGFASPCAREDRNFTLETDEYRRADFCLAQVFAGLTACQEAWNTALEGFNVRRSTVVNEWKAEARVEASVKLLCIVLKSRFGSLPEELAARISQTTDLDLLEKWAALAGEASSLDEFREKAGLGATQSVLSSPTQVHSENGR
jgi:hypothetical protein